MISSSYKYLINSLKTEIKHIKIYINCVCVCVCVCLRWGGIWGKKYMFLGFVGKFLFYGEKSTSPQS